MPKTDPITGCEVMTMPEFLQAEADREGKEPHEIMDELFQSLDEDSRQIESQYKDKENVLKLLLQDYKEALENWESNREYYMKHEGGFDDPRPPQPMKVLEVLDTHYHQGMRSSNGSFTALAECADGTNRYAVYSEYYDAGTRMDPPEGGTEVSWYYKPKLTKVQLNLLRSTFLSGKYVSRDNWWKTTPKVTRNSLESKGVLTYSGSAMRLTVLGKIALGIPFSTEES